MSSELVHRSPLAVARWRPRRNRCGAVGVPLSGRPPPRERKRECPVGSSTVRRPSRTPSVSPGGRGRTPPVVADGGTRPRSLLITIRGLAASPPARPSTSARSVAVARPPRGRQLPRAPRSARSVRPPRGRPRARASDAWVVRPQPRRGDADAVLMLRRQRPSAVGVGARVGRPFDVVDARGFRPCAGPVGRSVAPTSAVVARRRTPVATVCARTRAGVVPGGTRVSAG